MPTAESRKFSRTGRGKHQVGPPPLDQPGKGMVHLLLWQLSEGCRICVKAKAAFQCTVSPFPYIQGLFPWRRNEAKDDLSRM